jgi:hypothetical protein
VINQAIEPSSTIIKVNARLNPRSQPMEVGRVKTMDAILSVTEA